MAFDLPEALLIQSYYLRCAFPELRMLTYERQMPALSDELLEQLDVVLLPNFMLPETAAGVADLVVNVRSLSEMPAATIEEYLRHIDRIGRLFFFHENLCKERPRGRFGVPTTAYPPLANHALIAESESIWPRYQGNSSYPCHQHLFLHRSAFGRSQTESQQ